MQTKIAETISQEKLKELIDKQGNYCVSIYLPTHIASADTRENPIRFKSLVGQIKQKLKEQNFNPDQIEEFLAPLQELQDDQSFWQHQSHGLAVFRAEDYFSYWHLPIAPPEKAVLGTSFYTRSLLPVLTNKKFYLLALSKGNVRLFAGNRDAIREIELPKDMPTSLQEATRHHEAKKGIQFHTETPGPSSRPAVYHGQGASGEEEDKEEILFFLHTINREIKPFLQEPAPLVLAGVEFLLAFFREVADYPHILEEEIKGNPDELKSEDFHRQGWAIVEKYLQQKQKQQLERYRNLAQSDVVSHDIEKIVSRAFQGLVDTLFIDPESEIWGNYIPEENQVRLKSAQEKESRELIDYAAALSYRSGGDVYMASKDEFLSDTPIAAILRS